MTKLLAAVWLLAVTLGVTLAPVLAYAGTLQTGGPA
jgi:hypothetical protein